MRDYASLPQSIRERTDRRLRYLAADLAHPSLRVKRVRGRPGVYEGSVKLDYRFLFRIDEDVCVLERIGRHSILDKR